jgi:hypothetical protein
MVNEQKLSQIKAILKNPTGLLLYILLAMVIAIAAVWIVLGVLSPVTTGILIYLLCT